MSKGKSKSNPFDDLFSVEAEDIKPVSQTQPIKGKKSNKDYVASMTYLPKQLKLEVQKHLIDLQQQGIAIDFSELVAELLAFYLDIQQSKNLDIQISEFLDRLKSKYLE